MELVRKKINRKRRANKVRSTVRGTGDRPRLSIHISNHHVTAQLLDDENGVSLAYASTVGQKAAQGTMVERARWVGEQIAKKGAKKRVKKVVFDRGSRKYHGRVKALAEAARQQGMEF